MSKASLTEFTMFGSEYEAIDSRISDGCVFSVKKGTAGVTDPRLYCQLPFAAILVIHRTDGRDVIFVKKNSKPYKTDCGSVTNGDLLKRMNNRELADVIGFFARWMQRADIGEGLQLYFHFIKNI